MNATTETLPNGVNLANIGSLIEAITTSPAMADVIFKARSQWLGGTLTEVTVDEVHSNHTNISPPERQFKLHVDEPAYLGGTDSAPNPVEMIAAGLCGCLTAGIVTNSALFGTELEKVQVEVDVTFDVHGVLGLSKTAPNGAIGLHYKVTLKAKDPADTDKLTRSKETIDRKSPVKQTLELPLHVTTELVIE
ncbi:MAG: OsmC family protein [Janthinobacterium lividum]